MNVIMGKVVNLTTGIEYNVNLHGKSSARNSSVNTSAPPIKPVKYERMPIKTTITIDNMSESI